MNVLPDPVAIWASARGWLCTIDPSMRLIASTWIRRNPSGPTGPSRSRRALSDPPSASSAQWRNQRARVSGRWNVSTDRERGSGSNPSVNIVSSPVDSYRNGNGDTTAVSAGGRPAAYLAVCGSTPASGVPDGFASMAPTALPPTNSK
jgi:hypothetical protein